jgi:hypothetical protein
MEAVKEFAGMDESKPVIYPKAEALLTRMGRTLSALPHRHRRRLIEPLNKLVS